MSSNRTARPARSVAAARRRLRAALAFRLNGAQVIIGICSALLGFGLIASSQGRTSGTVLENARAEDLIRILDDLAAREQRLASEQRELDVARERLIVGNPDAALTEARRRADALAVLAGTAPVAGTGIEIVIADTSGVVDSPILLNAIQELRDAGAEAIQIGSVRVVASTWFADDSRGVIVSGVPLRSPIRIVAIGDSSTLETAMGIPGGVADTVRTVGARITIRQVDQARVRAVVSDPVTPPVPTTSPS
jgi:uncharacterized protein YlxW (UPF0749 family)